MEKALLLQLLLLLIITLNNGQELEFGTANPLTFKIISNTTITAEFELIDADGDKVADALDQCSDTPVGSG